MNSAAAIQGQTGLFRSSVTPRLYPAGNAGRKTTAADRSSRAASLSLKALDERPRPVAEHSRRAGMGDDLIPTAAGIAWGTVGALYAAACVWICVRLFNRRERWSKWTAVA